MDIRQIRYFIEVAQRLSFSAAAKRLFVAQSAISRHIAALEDELGVVLFQRDGRRIRLTQGGERFLAEAVDVHKRFSDLKSVRWDLTDEPSGMLKAGLPPSALHSMAAPAMTRFLARYPRVGVQLRQGTVASLRNDLLEGSIDLAVLTSTTASPFLALEPLVRERVYLVGPAGADFGGAASLPARAVLDYPQIVTANRLRVLREHGVDETDPLQIVAEVATTELIVDLVEAGSGYAVMVGGAFLHRQTAGRVRAVALDGVTVQWRVARRKGEPSRQPDRLFEQVLRETLAEAAASRQWPSLVAERGDGDREP